MRRIDAGKNMGPWGAQAWAHHGPYYTYIPSICGPLGHMGPYGTHGPHGSILAIWAHMDPILGTIMDPVEVVSNQRRLLNGLDITCLADRVAIP
jgi:hypothetical protein